MLEHRVPEERHEVVPLRGRRRRRERWDLDLVDQVAKERGLGQDLDVEEVGDRLEGNRGELLTPMEPAGRMDVVHRHGEDELPGEPAEPAA